MTEETGWASKIRALPEWVGSSFEEGAKSTYSRSDVLRVLLYPIGLLASLLPIFGISKVSNWLVVLDVIFLGAFLLLYAGVYIFCLIRRPDSLRSEKFELAKYAIEQSLNGDNTTGLREVSPIMALPLGVKADVAVNSDSVK
jgi:hypothetical protein